jgi:hypothetical protein
MIAMESLTRWLGRSYQRRPIETIFGGMMVLDVIFAGCIWLPTVFIVAILYATTGVNVFESETVIMAFFIVTIAILGSSVLCFFVVMLQPRGEEVSTPQHVVEV